MVLSNDMTRHIAASLEELLCDDNDDVLSVSSLSEIPDDATGYVLHVSGHGSVTLYEIQIPAIGRPGFRIASNDLLEIWSIA